MLSNVHVVRQLSVFTSLTAGRIRKGPAPVSAYIVGYTFCSHLACSSI